jgi:hypothetical protein
MTGRSQTLPCNGWHVPAKHLMEHDSLREREERAQRGQCNLFSVVFTPPPPQPQQQCLAPTEPVFLNLL